MESKDEIAKLKKDVARLKEQMAELQRLITVEERDDLPNSPKILNLRAAVILLCNPENPNQTQGLICGSAEGPSISLFGEDEKARVILKVDKEGATCEMYGKDLKKAVRLLADDETGRGEVGVCEQDKPRAVIKAAQTGGAVSVLHDDNHPRVLLHANDSCGEFMAVNQDLRTTVKITSDGLHGGMLTVHGSHGRPLVALCGSQPYGLVMINDENAKVIASLPSLPKNSDDEDDDE
jgi:hypothetical protein